MVRLTPMLLAASIVILGSIILVKMIDSYLVRSNGTPANPAGDVQNSAVGDLEAREVSSLSGPSAFTPEVTQTLPIIGGRSLIESHCSQCHLAKWLEKIEKPRSDWEKTMQRMEMMGVTLDDDEKAILIEYLSHEALP